MPEPAEMATEAWLRQCFAANRAAHPVTDGDGLLFDPAREFTIRADNQHSNAGYTLYEGRTVLGWPEMSFQRGKRVLWQNEIVAPPGQGRFLPTLESAAEPLKP